MTDFFEKFFNNPDDTYNETNKTGYGMYAKVYDSDEADTTIKVHDNRGYVGFTDGWLLWAIFCMNYKQKYGQLSSIMPDIKGLVLDFNRGKFYAAMKKLQDKHKHIKTPYITGNWEKWMYSDNEYYNEIPQRDELVKILEELVKEISVLLDGEKYPPIYIDAHDDNWMWDGDQIIFNDPFNILNTTRKDEKFIKDYNALLILMAENNPDIKIIGKT